MTDETQKQFPLDSDRVFSFSGPGGRAANMYFRRPLEADWRKFASGVQILCRAGEKQPELYDLKAGKALAVDTLLRVDGEAFRMRAGGSLSDCAGDWKAKLKDGFYLSGFGFLKGVNEVKAEAELNGDGQAKGAGEAEAAEYFYDNAELDEVHLVAWHGTPGNTVEIKPLIHRFTSPGVEHHRRQQRWLRNPKLFGSRTKGTTVYAPDYALFMQLYDELIVSVEDYTVGGQPLSGVDQIRREMDAWHKVAAIQALFKAPDPPRGEGDAE